MTIFQGRAVKLRGYPQKDGLEKVVPFKYDLFLVSIACNFCGVYYTHIYIYICHSVYVLWFAKVYFQSFCTYHVLLW